MVQGKLGQRTEIESFERKDNRTGEVIESREKTEHTPEGRFWEPPAHITCGLSVTKNLGNYESAKMTCQITRPCVDRVEEHDRVWEEEKDWVSSKIDAEVSALMDSPKE